MDCYRQFDTVRDALPHDQPNFWIERSWVGQTRPLPNAPLKSAGSAVAYVIGLLLAMSAHAAAAAPAYRPYMTGDQLVRDMQANPAEGVNSIRRERAMGYMDGVMDAAAGIHWCPASKSIPHELNYVVIEGIARLRNEQLKGNAAALIVATLGRFYPCAFNGGKR